jgi:hypothetical protein
MKHRQVSRRKRGTTKSVLRLLDLEHAKSAVLNSLTSPDAQRGYRHAIDEFVDWYCSEPRLAFNRIVVLRYRTHLESRQLAPATINLRLGAVRRLAYEAADCGLLSADLAAGIRRVKGVKKLGVRLGNWLTAEQGQAVWRAPDSERLKGKRDRALLALLLALSLLKTPFLLSQLNLVGRRYTLQATVRDHSLSVFLDTTRSPDSSRAPRRGHRPSPSPRVLGSRDHSERDRSAPNAEIVLRILPANEDSFVAGKRRAGQ